MMTPGLNKMRIQKLILIGQKK